MFSFGRGDAGQLAVREGEGDVIATPRWSDLIGHRGVRKVVSGRSHTVILLDDGTVQSCGANDRGQLGREEKPPDPLGSIVFAANRIINVACGHAHSVAVDDGGRVYSWGDNKCGQLGVGSTDKTCPSPQLVKGFVAVVQVLCGANHTLALAQDGAVYSWGTNTAGQLGHSNSRDPTKGARKDKMATPLQVRALDGQPVVHIAAGRDHSFAVTVSGAVFGWGRNSSGQLGLGNSKSIEFAEVSPLTSLKTHCIKFISCGAEHTAALTENGGVFTFGQGEQGQLGHGNTFSSPNPRMVVELMGSPVCQVACGSHHTLVLVKSQRKVYAFGLNDRGQLGTGGTPKLSIPTPVVESWASPEVLPDAMDTGTPADPQPLSPTLSQSLVVKRLLAGPEQSFVTVSFISDSEEAAPAVIDYRVQRSISSPRTLSFEGLKGLLDSALITKDYGRLQSDLRLFFSSRSLLNGSFLAEDHRTTSDQYSGVDIASALKAFALLRERTRGNADIIKTIEQCLSAVLRPPVLSPQPECLRLFYLLPAFLLPSLPHSAAILVKFLQSFLELQTAMHAIIGNWLFSGPRDYLNLCMSTIKEEISRLLVRGKNEVPTSEDRNMISDNAMTKLEMETFKLGVDFLTYLNKCNQLSGELLDHTHFHLTAITETVNLQQDYIQWMQGGPHLVVFCQHSFLLDANAKSRLMQFESQIKMRMAIEEAQHLNIFSILTTRTLPDASPNAFQLTVKRDHLMRDTLNQLVTADESSYRKPLKVVFEGEEGEDVGGVQKEFFMLLLQEVLNPDFGMFVEDEESHFIWFREQGFLYEDNLDLFVLIGILCGLAIYNFTIIDLPFPCALYKKLLDKPLSLEDLKELRPSIGAGLSELLAYKGDDFQTHFELVFALTRSNFGVVESVDLINKGSEIPVTMETREAYVQAYVDYVLVTSVKDLFQAFKHGFYRVCGGGKVLELMHPRELMSLVVGTQVEDWGEMEKHMKYGTGYSSEHPVIVRFWTVFNDFPSEVKKRFLVFMTGCNRIPIAGIRSMKMFIQFMDGGAGCERLPVAHTCFNVIDLPPYRTEKQMKSKLLQAINFTAGFGLL